MSFSGSANVTSLLIEKNGIRSKNRNGKDKEKENFSNKNLNVNGRKKKFRKLRKNVVKSYSSRSNNSREKKSEKNELSLIKNTEFYKNPEENSISSSALMLEEHVKKEENQNTNISNTNFSSNFATKHNNFDKICYKEILDELFKLTISLPSAYNDKLMLEVLNRLGLSLRNETEDNNYEVILMVD